MSENGKGPILIVMAAGMGSRYGGLKQMDPIGPDGEAILDYSLFDARRAGFRKAVLLIKHEIEHDFREVVGRRLEKQMDVEYAFQQTDMLPEGFAVPEGRTKPWGTGHAVLCCRDLIDGPFAAINADDYYGPGAFRTACDYLNSPAGQDPSRCMMVGYRLENTLTDNGYVSRGVCSVDENGLLRGIRETTHIVKSCDGPLATEDGETYRRLPGNTPVSMNMWGFAPSFMETLAEEFPRFLAETVPSNPLKAEFYLPSAVDAHLKAGDLQVSVLPCPDRWYGVTYREDKPVVTQALTRMAAEGLYPRPLWGK